MMITDYIHIISCNILSWSYILELQSNITVSKDTIEVRDGGKVSESPDMDDVQFIIYDIYINWVF